MSLIINMIFVPDCDHDLIMKWICDYIISLEEDLVMISKQGYI